MRKEGKKQQAGEGKSNFHFIQQAKTATTYSLAQSTFLWAYVFA